MTEQLTIAQLLSVQYDRLAEENRKLREQIEQMREERDGLIGQIAAAGFQADNKRLDKDIEFLNAVGQISSALKSAQQDRQKLIEAIERIRERAEAAEADDEWGWLQALRSIRRTIREVNVDET